MSKIKYYLTIKKFFFFFLKCFKFFIINAEKLFLIKSFQGCFSFFFYTS